MLPVAIISDHGKKRLKGKHPWIFSNEIDVKPEVLAGEIVRVQDHAGHFVGTGYYNPHTLIWKARACGAPISRMWISSMQS